MVRPRKTGFIANIDERVDKAIMEEKAMPEVRFKLDIFKAMTSLNHSEQKMRLTMKMNAGVINSVDKALFESNIIFLFNYIRFMVLAQKKSKVGDNPVHAKIEQLEYGKKNFGISELTDMKNYLLMKLHELNLTNLLIKEQDPLKIFEV